MISSLYHHSRSEEKPLRIGLLLDGLRLPRAFRKVLKDIISSDFSGLELAVLNREPQTVPEGSPRPSLYGLYQKFDARHARDPDPLEIVDCADLLGVLPRLEVSPRTEGGRQRLPAEAIAELGKYRLDVLLKFGFASLCGEILTAARCGVWLLHQGDTEFYRGGPSQFWEVAEGNPCSGAVLQVLAENPEDSLVLCKSLFATMPGLWQSRNAFHPYWGSTHFVIRKLHELHERGWEAVCKNAVPATPYRGKASAYDHPSGTELVRWLAPKIGIDLTRRLNPFREDPLGHEHWRICLANNPSSRLLDSSTPIECRWLPCPPGRYYADPFLLHYNRQIWLFFEDYSDAEERGRIVCAPVLPDLSIGPVTPCLDLPYHVSYPAVFEHGGEIFMIPESSANETVELWRATEFPFHWKLEKKLFRGPLMDTTPLFHEGRWYFFTAIAEPRGRPAFGALFSADQLTGEWIHHPGSPICTDVRRARSAGAIQRLSGRLLRPVQDCAESYGRRIHVQEILELTPDSYREQSLHSIEPDWEKNLIGVHTYASCGGIEALDAAAPRSRRKAYGARPRG